MLNGFDWNGQQVIHQANLFLQERLGMCDSSEHSVEASHAVDPCPNFFVGGKQVFPSVLITELRLVGKNGSELGLKLFADVHDECGANVVVERGVNDFEGPVRSERFALTASG